MSTERPNNAFLRALDEQDFAAVRPELTAVKLPLAQILYGPERPIRALTIPTSGIVSFVVHLSTGDGVEAGTIGNDSIIGSSAVLNDTTVLNTAVVQIPVSGFALDVGVARKIASESPGFRRAVYRHDQILFLQSQQSIACIAKHPLEARLCRWLLRCRDLAESEKLSLTQEFLAQMLGVQRSTLSVTAHRLQAAGLIEYSRGSIRILNLEGMKESSCECYGAIKELEDKLFSTAKN
ncbi:CRP-like cAMP-binding protein [Nitrobacteraceae bacterium AZCC 1564]